MSCTRGIPDHAIKVKNSVDVFRAFFTRIAASISSDTLKHTIRMSEKRSIPAPETVTVRKNNFASPAPVPLQIFRLSGLPWQYFYFIFNTYGSVNLNFYILLILSTNRLVIAQLLKMSLSMRKVWAELDSDRAFQFGFGP